VHHLWKVGLAAVLLAAGVFAARHFMPAGGAYAGTWKLTLLQSGVETTLCLLRINGDEEHPAVEVADAPGFASNVAEDVHAEDGALRFRLNTDRDIFRVIARVPKDQTTRGPLIGSVRYSGSYVMLRLEPTNVQELELNTATVASPGGAELAKALAVADPRERLASVRDVLKRFPDQAVTPHVLLSLLDLQISGGAPPEELRSTADRLLVVVAPYGREIEVQFEAQLAAMLARKADKGRGELAVEYGRRAEKTLTPDDPPELAISIFKSLAGALRTLGKDSEAAEAGRRVGELNTRFDKDFAEKSVSFQPEPPAGRHGASNRVVLAELFTGTQCPPCAGADIAFDAAVRVYKPDQVVFLQYHEHIPGPDPLANPATANRLRYYESEVRGTPTFLLDGKVVQQAIGGNAERGQLSYSLLHAALDQAMEPPASARLSLSARREGDTIELSAEVSDLQKPGGQIRLRFVLVENVARYAAPNGQRLHHHVVRDFPGSTAGFALLEKTSKQRATVNLSNLRNQLANYLANFESGLRIADDNRPLELRDFKAVAFIQDDLTKQVLQAAETDVPEPK
jgi:hypothetical protein